MIDHHFSFMGSSYNPENAIVLAGNAFDIGTRVFSWWEPKGFSQYDENRAEIRDPKTKKIVKVISGRRYSKRDVSKIHQVLVHHSGGDRKNPQVMRNVLHNERGLSVQFAIEDDGRIYQFLDAVECAWHAGSNNKQSIGVECCLFPAVAQDPDFYSPENCLKTGNLPHEIKPQALQGVRRLVFQMPDPQVDAVCRWAAGLWVALGVLGNTLLPFPLFPRDEEEQISRKYFAGHLDHVGLIGHLHCNEQKWDPAGFPFESAEEKIAWYVKNFTQNFTEF